MSENELQRLREVHERYLNLFREANDQRVMENLWNAIQKVEEQIRDLKEQSSC
jgi:hypothetical protein